VPLRPSLRLRVVAVVAMIPSALALDATEGTCDVLGRFR
jgi:hypothetical protein